MQTVCELQTFKRAADAAGMSADEVDELIGLLAENPELGIEIRGTGGCRKLRMAMPGTGKSGGYRIITFYTGKKLPIFLLTVFTKGTKISLTSSEKATLKGITINIVAEYKKRVVTARTGTRS